MATVIDNTLVINSPSDLEAEMCRYDCHTKEELEELLWDTHRTNLVLTYEYEEA